MGMGKTSPESTPVMSTSAFEKPGNWFHRTWRSLVDGSRRILGGLAYSQIHRIGQFRDPLAPDEIKVARDEKNLLLVENLTTTFQVTHEKLSQLDSPAFDAELAKVTREELIRDFGREFFKNPLTQQFCDAVVIGRNVVLKGKDGEVKVIDVGEIDGEKTKEKVAKEREERIHIAKLLEKADASDNKKQGQEQRAWVERKNGWYFHSRPLRLDSEMLVNPGKDEILIYPQPDNGFAYDFRGDTTQRIQELIGREGILSTKIDVPFTLQRGETPAPDSSVLRVYGFEKLHEMLEKQGN